MSLCHGCVDKVTRVSYFTVKVAQPERYCITSNITNIWSMITMLSGNSTHLRHTVKISVNEFDSPIGIYTSEKRRDIYLKVSGVARGKCMCRQNWGGSGGVLPPRKSWALERLRRVFLHIWHMCMHELNTSGKKHAFALFFEEKFQGVVVTCQLAHFNWPL